MSIFENIRDRLAEIPVIDAHEHICDFRDCSPDIQVTTFLFGGWMGLVTDSGDDEHSESERWRRFLEIWPKVRGTAPGSILSRILRMWGIDDNLTDSSYDALTAKISRRSPDTGRMQFKKANIRGVLPHYLTHPCCGGLANLGPFFKREFEFEPGFFPLLGTVPLHDFHAKSHITDLEPLADMEIRGLGDLEKALERIIELSTKFGVVGLKDHSAYTRGLAFGTPDRRAAENTLQEILGGTCLITGNEAFPNTHKLSDYLFDRIVQIAIDHDLPIALHTGVLAGGRMPETASITSFIPVLERYPLARFELYHLNYPWIADFTEIIRRYPNTFANCTWAHVLDPAATEQFLFGALGSFPADRIIAYGGDYLESVERQIACLDFTKCTVARALERGVSNAQLSVQNAEDIATQWFFKSSNTLYKLGLDYRAGGS